MASLCLAKAPNLSPVHLSIIGLEVTKTLKVVVWVSCILNWCMKPVKVHPLHLSTQTLPFISSKKTSVSSRFKRYTVSRTPFNVKVYPFKCLITNEPPSYKSSTLGLSGEIILYSTACYFWTCSTFLGASPFWAKGFENLNGLLGTITDLMLYNEHSSWSKVFYILTNNTSLYYCLSKEVNA